MACDVSHVAMFSFIFINHHLCSRMSQMIYQEKQRAIDHCYHCPGCANQVGKEAPREKDFAAKAKLLHELLTHVWTSHHDFKMSHKFTN